MQNAFNDVKSVMLKAVLVAESRGPWRGIRADVYETAYDNIYLEDSPKRQKIVIGVFHVFLIESLKKLVGSVLKIDYGVWQNN